MNRIKAVLIDIFDGVDDNSSISKIYSKCEVIFILGLLLLVCINQIFERLNNDLYILFYTFFVLFFSFQFFCRLFIIPSVYEHSNKNVISKNLKFIFVDFIAGLIPLFALVFIEPNIYHLSILSTVKIIRLFDLLPGFLFLKKAVQSKKEEILYSVLLVVFASFILSCLIYYLESNNPISPFKSVLDTLIWSFSKYTNDYGSIANFAPYSSLAKFFATINGLLGVAVFAVPGALLTSAFIEQITQSKIDNEIEQKGIEITSLFGESYWELSELSFKEVPSLQNLNETYCIVDRFWTFESIQARLMFTDNDILQIARRKENLILRVLNDSDNNKSHRHKILELREFPEYFDQSVKLFDDRLDAQKDKRLLNSIYQKRTYGYFFSKPNSRLLIINANDGREACLNHFTATLCKIANTSFVSQTKIVREPVSNSYMNFSEVSVQYKNEQIPDEFKIFISDIISCINNTHELKTVIIIRTADAKRGFDVNYTHGLSSDFASGSISNPELNLLFFDIINKSLTNTPIWDKSNPKAMIDFTFTHNHMNNAKLNNIIYNECKTINCITLYINRDIIQGWGTDNSGNSRYYSVLNALALSINDFVNESTNNFSRQLFS